MWGGEIQGVKTVAPMDRPSSDSKIITIRRGPRGKPSKERDLIDAFIANIAAATGREISRVNVWTVAGYSDDTEFKKFQKAI